MEIQLNDTTKTNYNYKLRAANGFYNSTSGSIPRDILTQPTASFYVDAMLAAMYHVCKGCLSRARRKELELCPDSKTAVFWYEKCLLRYSSQSIFSRLDVSVVITQHASPNVSDTDRFNQVLLSTMEEIAGRASNLDSGKYFAVQEAKFSDFQSLYALGQCTPDLSSADCHSCLRDAISALQGCCLSRLVASILLPSCNIRFENWHYYNISTPAPPSRPLPPPSNLPPASSKEKRQRISTGIIVAIVASFLVACLLFVMVCCFLASRSRERHKPIAKKAGNFKDGKYKD